MKVISALSAAALLAMAAIPAIAQPPGAPQAQPKASTSLVPPPDAPPIHTAKPGPYKPAVEAPPSLMSHTVYRPEDLKPFTGAKRLPIIAWGNGACSNAGLLFANFLNQIASHGYFIVASGPMDAPLPAFAAQTPGQTPIKPKGTVPAGSTKDEDLIKGIDWAIAQNADKASPYFGKLDPSKVAVMGQSCGGLQATWAAADPRVKTAVIWNSGVFGNGATPAPNGAPVRSISLANKDSLKKFHTPVAYFPGGPTDGAYVNSEDDFSKVTVPAFFGSIHSGHGGTYSHPGGGWFGEVGVAWLNWRLKGDKTAARWFEGDKCTLCTNPVWEVRRKNM